MILKVIVLWLLSYNFTIIILTAKRFVNSFSETNTFL